MVARAFIRYIEPHKQTRHPYNGKAKPGWWPPDVSYNGPDQLCKPSKVDYTELPRWFVSCILILITTDRVKVLCHIICNLREHGITADKLMRVVSGSRLKDPSRLELMYDVLRMRKMEEQLKDGALRMY